MADFLDEIIDTYKGESKPVFKLTAVDTDEYTIDLMNTIQQAGTQYAKSNIATPSEALDIVNDDKILSAKSIGTVVSNIDSLKNGDGLYATTTGIANTYIAEFATPFTTLVTGLTLRVTFNIENTGASTFKLDSLTTGNLKKLNGTGKVDVEAGDILVGTYIVIYDGTDWVIANQFKVKPMNQIFTTTGTFTAPFTGNYEVTVIGGGAVAGYYLNGGSGGGGAGGTAIKIVLLTKGDSVTVTIGSGATYTGAGTGVNGGASSFGGYCTANGGNGGSGGANSFGSGGSGGTAVDGTPIGNFMGIQGGEGTKAIDYNTNNSVGGAGYFGGFGAYGSGAGDTNASLDGLCIIKWMEG